MRIRRSRMFQASPIHQNLSRARFTSLWKAHHYKARAVLARDILRKTNLTPLHPKLKKGGIDRMNPSGRGRRHRETMAGLIAMMQIHQRRS